MSVLRRTNMSHSGFGPGGPLDKWSIMGHFDSEDFVCGLRDYVTSMKELHPDDPCHPTDDLLTQGLAMISLDQAREVTSAPEQGTPSAGGTTARGSASSQKSSMQRNLAAATTGWLTFGLSLKQRI